MPNDAMTSECSRSKTRGSDVRMGAVGVLDADLSSSPLTPALSPLRGGGVARKARFSACERCRVLETTKRTRSNNPNASNAATCFPSTKSITHAPSPLNGERAGVRGESKSNRIPRATPTFATRQFPPASTPAHLKRFA